MIKANCREYDGADDEDDRDIMGNSHRRRRCTRAIGKKRVLCSTLKMPVCVIVRPCHDPARYDRYDYGRNRYATLNGNS